MTYRWPATLRLPARPPKLVYLDLLHWVALAKANSGHRQGGQFAEVLASCLDAVARGAAVFPISDAIYMEVSKIGSHRQRKDLREVIERVSSYRVITSRVVIAQHEVEALLDDLVGPSSDPINTMDYLDWGVARAFGKVGGFRMIGDDGEDITAEVRAQHPDGPEAFDMILMKGELDLNRKSLGGPTPEEEPALRADGWDPRAAYEVANRRAQQEIAQVARFDADPAWRRDRIRDVVAAREIIIEINEYLSKALTGRAVELERVFPDPEETVRSWNSLPSFDVAVTMKTEYHRDPSHRWTPNDFHDIDALASTIPYCDVVVTDKAAASHVVRTGLAERLGTVVLSRTTDITNHL
jgi:hypothetical protein